MLFDESKTAGAHSFKCCLVNARLRCPFIQMLIVKVTSSESIHANAFRPNALSQLRFTQLPFAQKLLLLVHSCKCFPTKGNLHFPIHANAFRPKATCILLFVQMLFELSHLRLSLASPASRPKATFTAPFIQMLFSKGTFLPPLKQMLLYKRHFSAAIGANAFIQKALFCSPLKQMLFISLISNLSIFHLLLKCYVIFLGPALACIFIKMPSTRLISQSFAGIKKLQIHRVAQGV